MASCAKRASRRSARKSAAEASLRCPLHRGAAMADSTAARARSKPWCRRAGGSLQLTPARKPWAAALMLSASLSLLFILVYGGCNALAAQRTDLRTCFFAWELRIPFVPALILPYMSIDLFFVVSPFLCQNVLELRTLGWRITAAI